MTTSKTPNELPAPPPPPSRQHRKKRLDIQGLRTLAIMGVVAHHISLDGEMQYFMNGGLGVDIFFIISGYLMGQILSSKPINGRNLVNFYMSRIHRIVPIHCVFLVITFIAAQCVLMPADFVAIRHDYLMALGFVTNFNMIIYGWPMRISLNHLWTLGVEMQFYLFAPMLVGIIGFLSSRASSKFHGNCIRLLCLALISLASFVTQHFIVTNREIPFASLCCRVWQFTLGMMAFFSAEMFKNEEKMAEMQLDVVAANGNGIVVEKIDLAHKEKMDCHCRPKWRLRFLQMASHLIALSLFALLLIVPIRNRPVFDWFYYSKGMVITIPVILLTVAMLTFHAILGENVQSILLTNPIMVHLGDTSYVLYLVHYPVTRFAKTPFKIAKYGVWDGIAAVVASILLAELLHWLIDTHFRAIRSRILVIKLIVCLYMLCGLILLPTYFGQQLLDVPSRQFNQTHI